MKTTEEKWKDIPDYEGLYQASNHGRIKSLGRFKPNQWGITKYFKPEKILSYQLTKDGYPTLKLSKNGKTIRHRIHRLIAITFLSNPENKEQVNHKNAIKTDNRVENLEWNTQKENQLHACVNGLKPVKLCKEEVISIREDKRKHIEIAESYGISFQTVSEIKNNKIWAWL